MKKILLFSAVVFSFLLMVDLSALVIEVAVQDTPQANHKVFREALQKSAEFAEEKVVIKLGAGIYHFSESIIFNNIKRTKDCPLIITAESAKSCVISAGIELPLLSLPHLTDDAILLRIPQMARNHIRVINLSGKLPKQKAWEKSFRGYAGWPELFIAGKSMRLARWPNSGYAKIAKVIDRGSRPRNKEKPDRGGIFQFSENNPLHWQVDEGVYLGGFWCHKWYDEFIKIAKIDKDKRIITMDAPHRYGLGGNSKGLYFAINLLEELDQAGEYVFDAKNECIYFYPPKLRTPQNVKISLLNKPLFELKNCSNIFISKLTIENGCSKAFSLKDCQRMLINSCVVRNFAESAVDVSGGKECLIRNSHFYNLGKSVIILNGGDRKSLTPSKHLVENCHIHHYARLQKTYAPAVSINGVGQVVRFNYIHHAPHQAFNFSGNNHRIENNRIENVCLDTSDAGAIYCGRDWTLGGTVIKRNYFTKLSHAATHFNWAIYLDDMASGITVTENIIIDTPAGILLGGGRSNNISKNIMVNCTRKSVILDNRAMGWAKGHVKKPTGSMWMNLAKVPYKGAVWQKQFSYLTKLVNDQPAVPKYNVVVGNKLYHSQAMNINAEVKKYGKIVDNRTAKKELRFFLKDGKLCLGKRIYFPCGIQPVR